MSRNLYKNLKSPFCKFRRYEGNDLIEIISYKFIDDINYKYPEL